LKIPLLILARQTAYIFHSRHYDAEKVPACDRPLTLSLLILAWRRSSALSAPCSHVT